MPSNINEDKIVEKSLVETVKLRAKLKGEYVAESLTRRYTLDARRYLILSADTEVILGKRLLGKPKDYKDAVRMMKLLSGKTHEVISGFYLVRIQGRALSVWKGFDRSKVTFRKLTKEDIKLYLSITEYSRYTGSYALIACPQCLHQLIQKVLNPKNQFASNPKITPHILVMHGRRASPQNFITKIEGSISNVIGLPLEKVIPILRENLILRV